MCLKPFLDAGDVGANVGLFSVLSAFIPEPTGSVVSFECDIKALAFSLEHFVRLVHVVLLYLLSQLLLPGSHPSVNLRFLVFLPLPTFWKAGSSQFGFISDYVWVPSFFGFLVGF